MTPRADEERVAEAAFIIETVMPLKTIGYGAVRRLTVLGSAAFPQAVGPHGGAATPSESVTQSDADLAGLKAKGYKAALLGRRPSTGLIRGGRQFSARPIQ